MAWADDAVATALWAVDDRMIGLSSFRPDRPQAGGYSQARSIRRSRLGNANILQIGFRQR